MKLKSCFIFITLSLLLGQSVQAVGVGVKPKAIDLAVKVGKVTETEFLVVNVASEPAIYQIYADGLENQIELEPTDFSLEANANQIVKVKVKIENPGLFSTNISVVARPLGAGGLTAASGVKIPITIKSSGIPLMWFIGGAISGCLFLIFALLLIIRLHKSKRSNKLKFI